MTFLRETIDEKKMLYKSQCWSDFCPGDGGVRRPQPLPSSSVEALGGQSHRELPARRRERESGNVSEKGRCKTQFPLWLLLASLCANKRHQPQERQRRKTMSGIFLHEMFCLSVCVCGHSTQTTRAGGGRWKDPHQPRLRSESRRRGTTEELMRRSLL